MNADRLLALYERIADAPDAVARLRRFILDLAIRGKLVPQDQADEPASTLLKRIAAEKARTEAGRTSPGRQSQGRQRTEDFDFSLPAGWALSTLGAAAFKITDGTHHTPTYLATGVPFVSVKDFSAGELDLSNTRFIAEEEHRILYRRCDPKRGDVLIGRIGTLGRAVLVDTDEEFSLFVSVGLIRFSGKNISPRFFCMLLNSPLVEREFNRIKIGGGTHTNKLNLGDLKTVTLPLPPLAEQHRIVAKVDELMALCDRLDAARADRETKRDRLTAASLVRLNVPDPETIEDDVHFALGALSTLTTRPDQIKQLRQTILNLAVRGKLVPQDANDESASELLKQILRNKLRFVPSKDKRDQLTVPLADSEIPFDLPSTWAWTRIGEVCSKTGSGSTPRGGQSVYRATGIPFLRSQNIYDDGLRLDEVAYIDQEMHHRMSGTVVRPDDLLLNITGGSIGRCCLVPQRFIEANVSQHVAILRPAIGGLHIFLHKMIMSSYFQAFIFDEQTGAGRGGLPKNRMDRIPLALPPLAEQHRIVAKVDELMALCDRLEASLTTGDDTRRRLLNALLAEALAPDDVLVPEEFEESASYERITVREDAA